MTRRDDAPIDHLLDRINKDFGGDMADLLGTDWEAIIGPAFADAWIDGYDAGFTDEPQASNRADANADQWSAERERADALAASLAEAEKLIAELAYSPYSIIPSNWRKRARAFLDRSNQESAL